MADTATVGNNSDKLPQDTTSSTTDSSQTAAAAVANDTEMVIDSTENKDKEKSNGDGQVAMETDADKKTEKAGGGSDKEDKDAEEVTNPLNEEELRVYRDIIISAATETVTIKPFTLNNIQEQTTAFVFNKAREFTLQFKEKEGTLTCRFEPNRDWRARFVIKGVNKLLAANPNMTIECAPLFRQLLDQEKEGKPIGLFHTQMSENKSLYVGGVPQDTTEAQLMGFFPKSTKLHLPCHLNGAVRGWAVVEFDTPEDAEESITNQKTFVIGDNTVTVVRLKKHDDPRNRRAKLSRKKREKARAAKKNENPSENEKQPNDNKRKATPVKLTYKEKKKMKFQSRNNANKGQQNNFGRRKNLRMPGKSSLLGYGPILGGMGSSMSRMGNMGGMASNLGLGAFGGMGSNMGMMGNMGMNNMGGMGTNMGANMGTNMGMGGMSGMGSMVSGMGMSSMRGDNMNMGSGRQWSGGMGNSEQMNPRRMSRRERKKRNRNNSEGSQQRMLGPGSMDKSDSASRQLQSELSSRIDKVVSGERQGKGSDEDMVAMLQTALQAVQRRLGDPSNKDPVDTHSTSPSGSGNKPQVETNRYKPQVESNRHQNRNQQGNRREKWGQGTLYSGSGGGYSGSGGYGESGVSSVYDYNKSSSYDSYGQFDSGKSIVSNYGASNTSGGGSWGSDQRRFNSSGSLYGTSDTYSGSAGGYGGGGSSYSSFDSGPSRGNIWDNANTSRPNDSALQGVFSNYQSGYNYKY